MSTHAPDESSSRATSNVSSSFKSPSSPAPEPHPTLHDEKLPDVQTQQQHATDPPQETAAADTPRTMTGWKWALSMTAILSSIFLYALDATVTAAIQPAIIAELDAVRDLSWISVGFVMAGTATNMVWGRIYTQFNPKWLYLFNVVLFEAGSALCGAAPNMNAMIVGRVICGIGGAGLYVGVMTLIAISTTMTERPMYVGLTGLVWGLGIVLGPVVGGGFHQSAVGWRWAFYINLFIGAAAAPAWLLLLPSQDPLPGVPMKKRTAELDFMGIVLVIGAIVSFVMAINWGGVVYPWRSGQIIGLFVTAAVLFGVLAVQQMLAVLTTPERRMIPVHLFSSRKVMLFVGATFVGAPAAFVPIYFVPLFFQFVHGDSALDAGVRLLPLVFSLVVFMLLNGSLMGKLGYYMPWYTAGGLLTVIGASLMFATIDKATSDSHIYGFTVLIGIGVGMYAQASFSAAQGVVDPKDVVPAIGLCTTSQFLGITVVLAIANAVFLNHAEIGIREILPDVSVDEINQALQGASNSLFQSLSPQLQSSVTEIIVGGISKTYILTLAAGASAVVLSLLMKREKLFVKAPIAAGL